MDNTSVPLSGRIPGHHQHNISRALYLWATPVFHHQRIVPVDIRYRPTSGLIPVDITCIASTAYCACKAFQLFHHQGNIPGHHQYDISRALYLVSTYLGILHPVNHYGCIRANIVPKDRQYTVIKVLYLWTASVFQHQGLYLDIISIKSAGHYTGMTSSVYHHQCILPLDNIHIPSSGLINTWKNQYTIIGTLQVLTASVFHHQGHHQHKDSST